MKVYVKHIILLVSVLALLFPVGKGYAQTTADQQVPQGEQRTYSVTAEPNYQYHWSVSSGGSSTDLSASTGNSVTITWDGTPGIYTLELSVTQIHVNTDGQQIAVCNGDPRQISVEIVEPYTFELVDDHNIMSVSDGETAFNGSVFTNDFMLSTAATNTKALPLDNLAGQSDLIASVTQQAKNGFVVIGIHDGNYSYMPDNGYAGHDSFSYKVERNGIIMESRVQFEILRTNPSKQYPPVAFNDEARAPAGTTIHSTVLNNDIDLNGDPLTVNTTPAKGPLHGTVVLHADGTYIYTPSTPNPVDDEFTYEVTDGHSTVEAKVKLRLYDNTNQNNPPFGGDDLFMSFMKEKSGSVAPNDLSVDGKQALTYKLANKDANGPDHGMVNLKTDGSFSYTPNPGYIGADHFVYEVSDGTRQTYATAYVYVMADLIANAGNDTTVSGCGTVVADASGSQGLDLRYDWTSTTGTFDNPTAQVTNYVPDGPGQHELILTVTNSAGLSKKDTMVATVLPLPEIVMDAPETLESGMSAVLDASGTTGNAPLTFHWSTTDGTIEGVSDEPILEISSPGTYTLDVKDSSGCPATDIVVVQGVNHAPVAYDDFAATSAQEPINIGVLANDVDVDNNLDTSSVTILLKPSYGDVKVLPDGTINYIPTEPYQGNDQFTYQVCDLTNLCDSAVVVIDVSRGPFVIPEAFSPNSDGFNDAFEIKGIEQYPGTVLTVYNRWQSKVYVSKDYKNDWDGKCNTGLMSGDRLLPVGTYYYVLTLGGTHKTYKGFVYIAY
ncbi:Ig-like domain-containing protein [Prolixibacter denitrificans]|uniref:Gliding motility-associated-like protein n=1 Tax=Prolixibacter denitrificans TaxID=1541063 RepID=A0A2P8CL75_9BACT|nr:Ig-like domain-containing protein [Prolixibacter denitrificans]PSK85697.1 gliding motility-associated-like protein [Prolixibacter denitrificans]GET20316.1 hypothetical protein JCM18694_05620 [Prolixibacter denitrificans]